MLFAYLCAVLHGASNNLTTGHGYNYTLHIEQDDKDTMLVCTTFNKKGGSMMVYFKKKSDVIAKSHQVYHSESMEKTFIEREE